MLTSSFPTQVQQTVTPASNAAAVFNLTNVEDGVAAGPPRYTFFPNHTGASFGTHKGSFNTAGHYVPYFKPSPYVLGDGNPTSFGPFSWPAMGTWGNTGPMRYGARA